MMSVLSVVIGIQAMGLTRSCGWHEASTRVIGAENCDNVVDLRAENRNFVEA
jgi:hypothetical protein